MANPEMEALDHLMMAHAHHDQQPESGPRPRGFCGAISHALCYEPAKPTHKNQLKSRWPIMLLLCVGLFASYYVFDIPAATEGAMQTAFEGASNSSSTCINGTAVAADNSTAGATATFNNDFNLLYSVYSWPNVILPFFGGYISDKLGVRLMGVVFMALIGLGQVIVALGSSYISSNPNAAWYTMWIGRTVFGFGGESLSVVQSALVASYFQGRELAFAMGINLALARVGSVVNNEVSAVIASRTDVALAYWVGAGVCGLAVISMCIAFYYDLAADNKIRASHGKPPLKNAGLIAALCGLLFCRCCRKHKNGSTGSGAKVAVATATGDDQALVVNSEGEDPYAEEEIVPTEEIHPSAVLKFPLVFWVLTLSCLTIYIDVLTFNNNCADFVTQKWLATKPTWQMCDSDKNSLYLTANSIMSITYLVAGFMTPLFGSVCDYLGGRAYFNVFAAGMITSVHVVLGQTKLYPAAPLVVLGLCYSIYASALWPSIALVIPGPYQATAYGLVTAVQNFGLAVSPLIVGTLMPDPHCPDYDTCVAGWTRTEWFFVYLGCAGVACGLLLNVVDKCCSKAPILNMSNSALEAREKKEKEAAAAEASGTSSERLLA